MNFADEFCETKLEGECVKYDLCESHEVGTFVEVDLFRLWAGHDLMVCVFSGFLLHHLIFDHKCVRLSMCRKCDNDRPKIWMRRKVVMVW